MDQAEGGRRCALAMAVAALAVTVAGPGCSGAVARPGADPCVGVTCGGHGSCAGTSGQPVCTCESGWVPSGATCVPAGGGAQDFPATAPWYQDVSAAEVDPDSAALIAAQAAAGGWATGDLEIDFSIKVLRADATVPRRTFTRTSDFYDPDCDPAPVPVPPGGFVENSDDYACPGGDCHLIVYQGSRLYEMWRADVSTGAWDTGTFQGGCAVVWDLTQDYWQEGTTFGRGDQCTSADAAGHPIAPLLFTAEELRAGEIGHAIRFILDNAQIRADVYVHPATHGDGTAAPDSGMLPYGARLRLRADFDEASLPSEGARVVARALKRYGMFLSDAGGTPLTAEIDARSEIGALDLASIRITDFEVLKLGPLIPFDADCRRTPVTQ